MTNPRQQQSRLFESSAWTLKNSTSSVRTRATWFWMCGRNGNSRAGHVPGATNIDVNAADFEEKVAKLDKNKTYLVHCAAGSRSARACKKLEGMGFTELSDLARDSAAGRRRERPWRNSLPLAFTA